jgi:phage anti-repressor protein
MEFSQELALSLIQSTKPFPVDFEEGWQWLGYSSKHKAKEKLKRNFEEGIDFEVFTQMGVNSTRQGVQGGRPSEKIFLSIDCFKSLGMMAGTSKGKEVRQYFLKCERIAKKALEVIPIQSQEIERLKLELDLAKTQERLLMTTNAIATLHGTQMVALILGKPDAVLTIPERVETLVAVDNRGRAISSFDGVGITYLTKRYNFKTTQACRRWLESIGILDSHWIVEPALIKTRKLPRDLLPLLDRQYAAKQGVRQRLLGEST